MSAFCKVEMPKLPFSQMAEAKIGISDDESSTPGGTGMTQFGRALAELNIEIICANSS